MHSNWAAAQSGGNLWRRPWLMLMFCVVAIVVLLACVPDGLMQNNLFRDRLYDQLNWPVPPMAIPFEAWYDIGPDGQSEMHLSNRWYHTSWRPDPKCVVVLEREPERLVGPIAPIYREQTTRLRVTSTTPLDPAIIASLRAFYVAEVNRTTTAFVPAGHETHDVITKRQVLWSGVLSNILILGAIAFLSRVSWLFFIASRRVRLLRHGLCPGCAYRLPASGRCPECGWQDPRRSSCEDA